MIIVAWSYNEPFLLDNVAAVWRLLWLAHANTGPVDSTVAGGRFDDRVQNSE